MPKKLDPKNLKAVWYKKLKDAGFSDIEQEDGNLKKWSTPKSISSVRKDPSLLKMAGDMEYYRLAGHFLNDHSFSSELERVIWEYHSNGMGVREIAAELKQVKVSTLSKTQIHGIVKRLTWAMKRRYGVVKTEDSSGH